VRSFSIAMEYSTALKLEIDSPSLPCGLRRLRYFQPQAKHARPFEKRGSSWLWLPTSPTWRVEPQMPPT
jgi:hypothetical protein